jgi:hypothetical protein
MSANRRDVGDAEIVDIQGLLAPLQQAHTDARINAYRHHAWAIRIRVIDRGFHDMARADREESVWKLLEPLPQRTRDSITMLLLLTPDEARFSLANLEFEQPTASKL